MEKTICKITLIFVGIFTLFNFLRCLDSNIPPLIGQITLAFLGNSTVLNGEAFTSLLTLILVIITIAMIFKE